MERPQPKREQLDMRAIRELLHEESARKAAKKAAKAKSSSRRRSSANSEGRNAKLSPIAEGSYQE